MVSRLLVVLIGLAACDSLVPAPDAPPDLRPHATVEIAPPPTALPPPPDPTKTPLVELTVRGRLTAPGAPGGRAVVVLTDGPCFQAGTHYLAAKSLQPGQPFAISAFPPSGTRVEVCGALTVGSGRVALWRGRSASSPLTAVGRGAVVVESGDVVLTKQEPVTLPADLKIE